MKQMKEVIIDIETAKLPDEEIEEYKKRFPKKPNARSYKPDKAALYWTTGQIVCVGMKWEEDEETIICTGNEYDTLQETHEVLKQYRDHYISFNGKKFDFQYITARAWKHLIPVNLPMTKFKNNHTDIFDLLGGTYGSNVVSLAELAHHFGIYDVMWGDGIQVEEWYQKKDFNSIKRHNSGDINTTYKIYHGFIKSMYRQA